MSRLLTRQPLSDNGAEHVDERRRAWARCIDRARERDGPICTAERRARGRKIVWNRCRGYSEHTHHPIRRFDCGAAWADVEVVTRVCAACHGALHRHERDVRVPAPIVRRAFDHLMRAFQKHRIKSKPVDPDLKVAG